MTAQSSKILQIVPRLPPYSDGVGDYARLLAQQLSKVHNLETEFVAFRPGTKTPSKVDGFCTYRVFNHTAPALLAKLPNDISGMILHYSNYPYLQGKLDAPLWLVDALKTLVEQLSIPLVVMFHELPTLKWKQIRILNPIQSRVSRRLCQIASTVVTDSHHFKTQLAQWTDTPIACIPDFSTIGEPQPGEILPLDSRQRRVVIFGGSDRRRVYKHSLENLLKTCQALGIKEICDIGTPQNLDPEIFKPILLTEMGFQPADTVRAILLDSVAGVMDYSRFPGDLGKSSVFAAFCAHGLMPICTAYNPSEPDDIFVDQQYAIAGSHLSTWTQQQRQHIATQARAWYCQHNLDINARLFASSLAQNHAG
ncbi:MAG: hypothetical protein AAFV72_20220 [Cyanobacteria bacterium J06635_1]